MLRLLPAAVSGVARQQAAQGAAGCTALQQVQAAAAALAAASKQPQQPLQQHQQANGLLLLSSTSPWLLLQPHHLQAQLQGARAGFASQAGSKGRGQQPDADQLPGGGEGGAGSSSPPAPPASGQKHGSSSPSPEDACGNSAAAGAVNGNKNGAGKRCSTGASTAAQHNTRRWSAAGTQREQLQQLQQQLQELNVQQKQQQAAAAAAAAGNGGHSDGEGPAQHDHPPPPGSHRHPSSSQQQQPKQFKIVQYSRGTSTLLSLSSGPDSSSGGYSLSKVKGPASASDIAAFARRKPPRDGADGAAASADAARPPLPLLLRPLDAQYRRLQKVLTATFLPAGYPTSVGSNYLEYTLWQAVTNFATTANGVLASTFLLYSVGLGAGAIPTAGALNWVLKDGLGQLGTLLFGKTIAHNFDIHSKTWYFMSLLLLSSATGLEIATILVPQAFLVLGSVANMIKGLSWMAGGSTRSVFNLSFVRDNNIADITAKNTSQYIFASLFGTAAGVSCCAYIGQSAPAAAAAFSALAYTSLYAAYRTVKAIPLPTLNSTRLQLLAARYLKCVRTTASGGLAGFPGLASYQAQAGFPSYQREYEVPEEEDDTCELQLPSPLEMAEMDNPLPWVMGDPRILNPGIHVGSQLDRLVEGQPELLLVVLHTFRYARYLLLPERNAIHLVLHAEAQPRDMVQAYLQACILRKCLKTGRFLSADDLPQLRIVLHDTLLAAENLTPPFMRALARQGWQTEKIVVEAHRRRARW